MTGSGRRQKGKRLEYAIRDHIRALGFSDAVRVPLSGASEGYKGDVAYTDQNGRRITIEAKSRRNGFSTIYKKFVNTSFEHPVLGKVITYDFEKISKSTGAHIDITELGPQIISKRDLTQFVTLHRMMADANMLVIKDNGKQMLLIQFGVGLHEIY